jgi:homoserine kinase
MGAMVEAGAVSAWLSGSGPTAACFVRSGEADRVMAAVPTNGRARVVSIDHRGVRLVDV